MLSYSEKVKDHFFNPKNAGVLAEANAVGEAGTLARGDALKLMLRVDPEAEVIVDARFQTFGGGAEIASSSALTELVIGKTLGEALALGAQDIAAHLGGLPPERMGSAALGQSALQAAVAHYRGEVWTGAEEPGALVCKCNGVHEGALARAIKLNRLTKITDLTAFTRAGSNCFTCYDRLEELLARVDAELVAEGAITAEAAFRPPVYGRRKIAETPVAKAPAKAAAPVAAAPFNFDLNTPERIRLIEETIEELRPYLKKDGGDCHLEKVEGDSVHVRMSGACVMCKLASATVSGIQEKLIQKLGMPLRVIPIKPAPFTKLVALKPVAKAPAPASVDGH
ncbi:Fe-S cluster assembly protein NifU [Methylocella sp.]|uniref:Fe-S cluster assembly protein NifU n=1 Tax=Methylocella sp. TaxID=1978226 RepID=UPI003784B91A